MLSERIKSRYDTLIKNIKSSSNSFYDSYLDLFEEILKNILEDNNIKFDSAKTCGYIFKSDNDVKSFIMNKLLLDDFTYNKLGDYIQKINKHKHSNEKSLTSEILVNYMKVFYDFINCYRKYKNIDTITYDSNHYVSIFGETERINEKYKLEIEKLKGDLEFEIKSHNVSKSNLEKLEELKAMSDIEVANLDEENQKLQEQINILKDIKLDTLELKMNKAIDILNQMQNYLIENRILAKETKRLIDGKDIDDLYLEEQRKKICGRYE